MRFFSPFESNCRVDGMGNDSGWKWYWKFLKSHPHMNIEIESDCWDCLAERGLVIA